MLISLCLLQSRCPGIFFLCVFPLVLLLGNEAELFSQHAHRWMAVLRLVGVVQNLCDRSLVSERFLQQTITRRS